MLATLLSQPLDQTLAQGLALHGPWAFALVALVVLAETGLVVAPFLPGDSLLFASGAAVGAAGAGAHGLVLLLAAAAVAGDTLNYAIGRRAGRWLRARSCGRGPARQRLAHTRAHFRRFGAWTLVVARFVPVLRTLAPFLAGAGRMPWARFAAFNVAGGVLWVASLVYAGAAFGALPWVRAHLGAVSAALVALSLLPLAAAALRARRRGAVSAGAVAGGATASRAPRGPT